jgi:hypothetical protein
MTIATLDGVLAGMQMPQFVSKAATPTLVAGRPHSSWYLTGAPGPGSAVALTAGGVALSSSSAQVAGQIPHTDPVSGNAYLAKLAALATIGGELLLCDRLLQVTANSAAAALGPTLTTAQTINSNALPARDMDGSTNGRGVFWGMEISSVAGAGTPTISYSYTNSAGTAGQAGANIDSVIASSAAGAFYRLGVAAGDLGVRSVQSLTLSATMTSGSISLVAYRVLAAMELVGAYIGNQLDALTSGFPRLFNGTVPFFLFIPNTTTASLISAQYIETQG